MLQICPLNIWHIILLSFGWWKLPYFITGLETDSLLLQPKSLCLDASLNKKVTDVLRGMAYIYFYNFLKKIHMKTGRRPDLWLRWWQIIELCDIFLCCVNSFKFAIVIRFSIPHAHVGNLWFISLCRFSTLSTWKPVYLDVILLSNLQTSVTDQWLEFRKQKLYC